MRVLILGEQLRRPVPGGIGTYLRGLRQGLATIEEVEVSVTSSRLPLPILRRFDVVHAPSLFTRRTAAPLSVMVHDVAWRTVPEAYPPGGRRWHERALVRVLRQARLLLAPSDATAVALNDPRVRVVEEGCDHLAPPDDEAAAKLLAGLGVHGPFLLTLSTLEPRKNLPRLVAAYRAARPQLPERWPLVVVGPSGWGPELRPEEGVVLAGFVDEPVKSAFLRQARLLAYVPLLEGFGLPAVEAMAVGTPVVASPMPSLGGAGRVVDPLDVDEMTAALVEVATVDDVRRQLIDGGSARTAGLTWAAAARRHVELWSQL